MSREEIADAILRGIQSYESGRIFVFNLAVTVERLAVELAPFDIEASQALKALSLQLAGCDIDDDTPRGSNFLFELRQLAARISP
jgi:hypothetical protein